MKPAWPKTSLNLFFGMLGVFLASPALAASVGFYAATFDPPTRSQLRIIGCALGDAGLPRECHQLAKQISHLIVWVNDDTGKDTLASTRERLLMVKTAVQKYGAKVEVVASAPAAREARRRALLRDKEIDQVFHFLDADGYRSQKAHPASYDPRETRVVFPLEAEAAPFKLSPATENLVAADVKEIVEDLGLYQQVDKDLEDLQKSLFQEGWKDLLDDLSSACLVTLTRNECAGLSSYWKTISVVTEDRRDPEKPRDAPAATQLTFKRAQSEDRWAEKYTSKALALLRGSEGYDKFKPVADDIAARTLQGYPRGKVPHLRRVSIRGPHGAAKFLTQTQKPLGCPVPRGSYHADIEQYVADRFPRAFAEFLKKEIGSGSISSPGLYVHNHPIQEAYDFHKRDGYATFYFLQTRRGQLHRDIHLAVRSNPRSYRVVLTSVRGEDRTVNVLCQVHHNGIFSSYRLVRAKNSQPLFVLNSQGSFLRLNERDILLFGFRGTWRRMLQEKNWQRRSLVKEGLDIDLFTHPRIRQKLVVARNVYGDDANIVLETFYKKGARRVIYLGSAGAIQSYPIGDVVIPSEFVDRHHNSVPFQGNIAMAYRTELSEFITVHAETKHAWAQSLFDETEAVLRTWKERSVAAVDIEGIYLGRFARRHPDLEIGALFVISDQTLGENTIEETNANRGLIDASVDKLVSFLFPKLVHKN